MYLLLQNISYSYPLYFINPIIIKIPKNNKTRQYIISKAGRLEKVISK